MCECWYHAELSQMYAEQLLNRNGRDGAFLVRQSESVGGAFAICLMYLQQVHTYRVLPDENGLLSVQSVEGVEVKKFPSLRELIGAYRCKGNGLVTGLHYPVGRQGEAKAGDHVCKCQCWKEIVNTEVKCSSSQGDGSNRILNTTLQEIQPATRRQELGHCSLMAELEKTCKNLYSEVKDTLHSLKTLDQVFGQTSMLILPTGDQVDILDGLMCSIPAVLQSLSALEHKAKQTYNEGISGLPTPLTTCHSPGIKTYRAKESQHLKQSDKISTQKTAPQSLSVFVGTWNMGGSTPPRSLSSWLSARKIEGNLDSASVCVSYDLYMIGTQENPQGDREWAEFLRTTLISQTMNQYKLVCVHSLGGIKLALLVREEYEYFISNVHTSTVRTGISNTLGIRGAVGVSFNFNLVSLGFVNCHLMSGIEKVQKRNQKFGDILRGLTLGDETLRSFQLPLRLTYLFWAGDLNYKLDMPFQDVLQCIYSGQHQLLLPVDQLNQEREKKKIFLGFKEHPIAFPPTCRYERGSRSYDLQKAKKTGTRIFSPSWSDRILWTSYPGTEVKCTSYDCTDDIVTSDHSPVFSTFEVGLRAFPQGDCRYSLKFLSIEAIIKTQSRSQGYIEFRSLCLKGQFTWTDQWHDITANQKTFTDRQLFNSLFAQADKSAPQSSVNSAHNSEGAAFLKLGWSEQDLPELTLVEDLTQSTCAGHILLSIRPTDGGDSYGECCVPLQSESINTEHHIQVFLSQRGEETGSLRSRLRMSHFPAVNPERSPNMADREREKVRGNAAQVASAAESLCGKSRSSTRFTRQRPASVCCESYSNAEYFMFESFSGSSSPTSPRPRSALVSGEKTPERGQKLFRDDLEWAFASSHSKRPTFR